MLRRTPILIAVDIFILMAVVLSGTAYPVYASSNLRAFPGAEGYGTQTIGGRGGKVLYVTNLENAGIGSLRFALETAGPRVVMFRVAGTITLDSDVRIIHPYITLAGQSAPGEGVQIRGAQIKIATHDVVIRYLKVRSGDAATQSPAIDRDALTINDDSQVYNVVIDHSTLIWGPDVGGITFLNGARDATVSYSIIGEGLYLSNHPEGTILEDGHSLGISITELDSATHPTRITVHHNLITTSADRNPRVIGGEAIDVINNVIYNWKNAPAQGNPRSLNLVNNTFIRGPMTTKENGWVVWQPCMEAEGSLRPSSVYEAGNLTEGFSFRRGEPASVYAPTPPSPFSMEFESAEDAYAHIVADAGANRQSEGAGGTLRVLRDSVEQRLIQNLVNRTGWFWNGLDHPGEAGFPAISWPVLASGSAPTDLDLDGMPDEWEEVHFGTTVRGSPISSFSDADYDLYTDLEEYLNNTDPTSPEGGVAYDKHTWIPLVRRK